MGNVVVVSTSVLVIGVTRDDVVGKMDELGMLLLDHMGGEPWIAVDDDTVKEQGQHPLTDERGYFYRGRRTYNFFGPLVPSMKEPQHDGHRVQKEIEE